MASASGASCLMGIASDPAFGPVITFGAGGTLVELIADRSVALPPLNAAMAQDMISRTRVKSLLAEFRGTPAVSTRWLDRCAARALGAGLRAA